MEVRRQRGWVVPAHCEHEGVQRQVAVPPKHLEVRRSDKRETKDTQANTELAVGS